MNVFQRSFRGIILLFFLSAVSLTAQPILNQPAANATGVAKTPEYKWRVPAGTPITTFWIQVATANDFSIPGNLVYNLTSDNTQATFFTPTLIQTAGGWDYYGYMPAAADYSAGHQPLMDGTDYWWRVGYTTAVFSASRKFTTIAVPTLVSPADASSGNCSNPVLTWNVVSGATDYYIEIWTPAFGGTLVESSTEAAGAGPQQTYTPTNVIGWGNTYEWAVRAKDGTNWTGWSTRWDFTLLQNTALLSPADNSFCLALNPTLTWDSVPGATEYELEVYDDTNTRIHYNYLAGTSYVTSRCTLYNSSYTWRVRVRQPCETDWTPFFTFTTILETPTLFAPADGSTCIGLNPTLEWNPVPGAGVVYDIQVSIDGTFAGPDIVENLDNVAGTSVATTNLSLYYQTYYWRVLAEDPNCSSPWSSVWSFTTLQQPPLLASPADGSCGVVLNPQLIWNAVPGATEYELEVFDSTPALVHTVTQTDTFFNTTNCNLNNEMYTWHVRVTQPCVSDWSTTFSFETIHATPNLVSPLNFQPGISLEPTFTWTDVAGETSYEVRVYNDALLTNLVYSSGSLPLNTTSHTIPYAEPAYLMSGTNYYWVVEAFKSGCGSTLTLPWQFTTVNSIQPYLGYPTGCPELYSPDVFFSWYLNQAAPGVMYDLLIQLYINPGDEFMPSPMVFVGGLTTTTFNTASLLPGMTYYWRVRVRTSGGAIAGYSSIDCFNTFGDPSLYPAVPSWPLGTYAPYAPAELYYTTPTLFWYLNGPQNGLVFDVQVYQELAPNPDVLAIQVFSITDLYLNIPNGVLQPGYDYYWQVQSRNPITGEVSGFSPPQYFKIIGDTYTRVPVPSWPTGGNTVYTLNPAFYWYVDGPATGLTFDIIVTTNPADIIPAGPATVYGLPFLFHQLMFPLQPGQHYYWAVRSSNGIQTSAWSVVAEFWTNGQVGNLVPILSYPINNETVYTLDPYLSWYVNGTGAVSFDIEITTGALTGTPTFSGITDQYFHMFGLMPGTHYNWAVRSFNGFAYSNWSAPGFFTTYGGGMNNIAPVLTWPIGGNTVYTNTPTLYWFVNSSYTPILFSVALYWDAAGLFPVPGSPFPAGFNVNNFTIPNGLLVSGAMYYWQVFAHDGINPPQASSIESFVTAAGNRPVIPIAGSPAQGVVISSSSATLSWFIPTYSESEMNYEIEYSKNPNMSDASIIKDIKSFGLNVNSLDDNATYYWRVRSKTVDGSYSNYSLTASFSTGELITDVPEAVEIPANFEVAQNYPNPFNPSTVVRISLPSASYVTVKIYNMLGQEIRTLFNGEKTAGTHELMWNADDNFGNKVSSGTYIYRVVAGDNVVTKKMILMK